MDQGLEIPEDVIPLIIPASLFWRLPIIRHARTLYHAYHVAGWERMFMSVGMIPQDFDRRVLRQMWKGIV